MIDIDFDSTLVERKITNLANSFDRVPEGMQDQFLLWQVEDMNRSSPSVMAYSERSIYTMIKARGRPGRVRQRRYRIVPSKLWGGRRFALTLARRPILRPELVVMLGNRMRELLKGAFVWR